MSLVPILTGNIPPFGGAPQPQTGGADPQRKGLGGFLDRFLEPQNALGRFGRALVMAGGTPLGDAYKYMDQGREHDLEAQYRRAQYDEQIRKANLPKIEHVGDSIGIVDEATGGFTPTYQAPQREDPVIAQARSAGATDEQIRSYQLGKLDPLQVAPIKNEDGTITLTPYRRSQFGSGALPGAPMASQAPQPSPGIEGLIEPQTQVESGGNYAATGPMTAYGRAHGGRQMLDGTAQAMAAKLGLPWQPEMMRSAAPEAVGYQDKLANAYLQEGYDKTGNPRDALRYYHGGPNRAQWGRKTDAYADKVLGRAAPRISSKSEFDALPSGAMFVAPDGKTRRKP